MLSQTVRRILAAPRSPLLNAAALLHQQPQPSTTSSAMDEHVASARLVKAADPKYTSIELEMDDSESLRIPLVWLRDHCRSPVHYNWDTDQRRSDMTDLFSKAVLSEDERPFDFDKRNQLVQIRWRDGHTSVFHVKELLDWAVFTRRDYDECASRTYWNASTLKEVPSVSSRNFDLTTFSRLFVRFGIVAVVGVDARNERETKRLCESIAPYHDTFFGQFWVYGSTERQGASEDNAQGVTVLGPHTDGTYMDQPPGIQVLHCLRHAGDGDENTFVDGFAAAEQLRKDRPDLFEVLSSTPVEHHYMEGLGNGGGGVETVASTTPDYLDDEDEQVSRRKAEDSPPAPRLHARSVSKTVIECFKHKIIQVRFNPYDRAPLRTLRVVEMDASAAERNVEHTVMWYEAYERFSQLIHNDQNAVKVKLQPGTVLVLDNTRVLHARLPFDGKRKMCGCYLSRDALMAKARPLLTADYYKYI